MSLPIAGTPPTTDGAIQTPTNSKSNGAAGVGSGNEQSNNGMDNGIGMTSSSVILSSSPDDDSGSNEFLLIGAAVGGVVVLFAICGGLLLCFLFARRQNQSNSKSKS